MSERYTETDAEPVALIHVTAPAELRSLIAGTVPTLGYGTVRRPRLRASDTDRSGVVLPDRCPLIALDTAQRPDVADLARVLAGEPAGGDVVTRWAGSLDGRLTPVPLILLSVRYTLPVCCDFAIVFPVGRWRPRAVLAELVRCPWFAFTSSHTPDGRRLPIAPMVLVEANGGGLPALLALAAGRGQETPR